MLHLALFLFCFVVGGYTSILPISVTGPSLLQTHHLICIELIIHYNDVMMGAIASQITSITIVHSTVSSDADKRKHKSSASLAFVRGIQRGLVNSPYKWPVTRIMFPFDDVIMKSAQKRHSISRRPTVRMALRPSDVIWQQGTRSKLAQVMACCLTAPSRYLDQPWLIISEVL